MSDNDDLTERLRAGNHRTCVDRYRDGWTASQLPCRHCAERLEAADALFKAKADLVDAEVRVDRLRTALWVEMGGIGQYDPLTAWEAEYE